MLRSFVVLATSLNLSKTVKKTGVSRQTIRRHINELEEAKGSKLFSQVDRRYELTEAGEQALAEAVDILQASTEWISGDASRRNGLAYVRHSLGESDWFVAQQHPVNEIWTLAPPLLRRGLRDWTTAEGFIDHRALRKVRPYHLLYRKHN